MSYCEDNDQSAFFEVGISHLENTPLSKGLHFETPKDRDRRHSIGEQKQKIVVALKEALGGLLTKKQCEVVHLYFFLGKTQEDVAVILSITQSTVSRHLFGTVRKGKRVGGAIKKLRRKNEAEKLPVEVYTALETIRQLKHTA